MTRLVFDRQTTLGTSRKVASHEDEYRTEAKIVAFVSQRANCCDSSGLQTTSAAAPLESPSSSFSRSRRPLQQPRSNTARRQRQQQRGHRLEDVKQMHRGQIVADFRQAQSRRFRRQSGGSRRRQSEAIER
jgi:hypothetical protein